MQTNWLIQIWIRIRFSIISPWVGQDIRRYVEPKSSINSITLTIIIIISWTLYNLVVMLLTLIQVSHSRISDASLGCSPKLTTPMGHLTKDKLFLILKTDTGNLHSPMVESTKVCGRWTGCTDKVFYSSRMET